MTKKFIAYGLGLCTLILTGCQNVANPSGNNAEDTITIGGIVPLTGDGAVYGVMTQNVANLRVEEINESGGINGKKLEIIWEDGKCTPKDASLAAQKLVNIDKVNIIFGGTCSGETLGAAPITEKANVILFSSVSTSPEVTNAGDFVFRTAPSDSSQGKVLGNYANKSGFNTVALLSEQTDYAVGVAGAFKDNFDGEIIEETYLSTESDFKTRITKIKASDPDALFLNPQTPPKFEIMLKQLQEQGWDKPIISNEISTGNIDARTKYADFLKERGLVAANFVAPDNSELTQFVERYEAKFGNKPEYINYTASTLDGVGILKRVLENTDSENTEAIRDTLYALQDYEGVFGTLAFDQNGDVNITHSLFRFNGEDFERLEE